MNIREIKLHYILFITAIFSSFNVFMILSNSKVNSIQVDLNDKILAGGYFGDETNLNFAIARYNTNGALDTTFNPNGGQPGIVVTGIESNNLIISSIKIDANNKIVAGGYIQNTLGSKFIIARYDQNGLIDTTFNQNGELPGIVITTFENNNAFINAITIDLDNNIIATGYSQTVNGQEIIIAKYINNSLPANNIDGSLDVTFNAISTRPGIVTLKISNNDKANGITIDSNNKILISGFTNDVANQEFLVARYNQDGSLDNTFNPLGTTPGIYITTLEGSNNSATDIKIDGESNIIVIGNGINLTSNVSEYIIIKLTTNGILDTTFNSTSTRPGFLISGFNQSSVLANSLAIDYDNNDIIIAGSFNDQVITTNFFTARYNKNGTLDTTFGQNNSGIVITPVIDQNTTIENQIIFSQANSVIIYTQTSDSLKKIVSSGFSSTTESNFTTIKYNDNGTFDTTFNITNTQPGVIITVITNGETNTQDIYLPGGPDYNFEKLLRNNPYPAYLPQVTQGILGYYEPIIDYPQTGFSTNQMALEIGGYAQPGSQVIIYVDDIDIQETFTDYTGSWQSNLPELSDGEHIVYITAKDPLSNLILTSEPITVFINTAAPETPVILTPKDDITLKTNKVLISGEAINSSYVAIYINNILKKVVKTSDAGTWEYNADNLLDGKYIINAVSSDNLGNYSKASENKIFYITTKIAKKPEPIKIQKDNTQNKKEEIIKIVPDSKAFISGITSPNDTVTIYIDDKKMGQSKSNDKGFWEFNLKPKTKLKKGEHKILVNSKNKLKSSPDKQNVLIKKSINIPKDIVVS